MDFTRKFKRTKKTTVQPRNNKRFRINKYSKNNVIPKPPIEVNISNKFVFI